MQLFIRLQISFSFFCITLAVVASSRYDMILWNAQVDDVNRH